MEGGGLIIDALIKVECAECEHCDLPDLVINLMKLQICLNLLLSVSMQIKCMYG